GTSPSAIPPLSLHDALPISTDDRRFADPAWSSNPAYRRLGQSYLAWTASLTRLVDRYEAEGADWRKVERARFALTALTSTLAPRSEDHTSELQSQSNLVCRL